jgi:hypothetical protein
LILRWRMLKRTEVKFSASPGMGTQTETKQTSMSLAAMAVCILCLTRNAQDVLPASCPSTPRWTPWYLVECFLRCLSPEGMLTDCRGSGLPSPGSDTTNQICSCDLAYRAKPLYFSL